MDLIENIFILKLKKNDASQVKKNVIDAFGNKNIFFHEVDGCIKNDRNEGNINLSLWKILSHSHVDEVAKDITRNHLAMIRKAFMENLDYALFLEEDVCINTNHSSKYKNINNWLLQKTNKWDIFYLGYCNWPIIFSFLITKDIVRIYSPLAAHAYILNRRGMQKILNYTENGLKNMDMHIDKMYAQLPGFRKYAIFPMIAFQNKNPALFTKACDKINLNLSMKSCSIAIQYISVFIPILFILICTFLFIRIFWRNSKAV